MVSRCRRGQVRSFSQEVWKRSFRSDISILEVSSNLHDVTRSFMPFYNTTVNSISSTTTAGTPVQTDCSYGYKLWVVGVAAGIPSFLALVLAIILAVVCVLQWSNFRWKQTSECCEVQEEHEYEKSPPRRPNDIYLNVMEETTNVYVNEGQGKHFGAGIQTQVKAPQLKKPRTQPHVTESIYENHPPSH